MYSTSNLSKPRMSVNKMKSITFVLLAVFSMIPTGYCIKCNACQSNSMSAPNGCQSPTELTCPAPYDRCMTVRPTMKMDMGGGNILTMNMEIRNCTVSMMCTDAAKQQICVNSTGTLASCEYGCCTGDLCNGDGPVPTLAPNPPAVDLSCYECSPGGMGPSGTGQALISCKTPAQRKCGSPYPGVINDRCMTIKMSMKNPQTGAILEQETKNCSNSMGCNKELICNGANSTGGLVSCDVKCCTGSLCNGVSTTTAPLTTAPGNPKAGQTSVGVSSALTIFSVVIASLFKLFY